MTDDKRETWEEVATGEEPPVDPPGHGPEEADTPGEPQVEPGIGGYAGRDPMSEMPRVPSVPETQEDPKPHDAAPDDKERGPHD